MSDNLAPLFNGFRTLAVPQLVRLRGPDAAAFAQAQFANDVNTLPDGHWHWSAWLSAKGRVLAVFQLLRLNPQDILLVCHDGDTDTLVEQLRRFVFRRKVVIGRDDALRVNAAFQPPEQANGAQFARLPGDVIELDVGSAALPRSLHVTAHALDHDDAAELAWRRSDLRFGLARLDGSQREQWTPQQLGLDRLSAYSVRKGCYPGQEIVARTHFLGKAKRSLALLECAAPVAPGDAVQHEGAAIGTVASAAGTLALAVLPLELPEGPLQANGQPAHIEPLLDGLAR